MKVFTPEKYSGFVEFENSEDASDAVYELNGERLCGERVTIEIARGGLDKREWRDSPTRPEPSRRHERPHRTQYAVRVENLSSRCRFTGTIIAAVNCALL